MIKCDNPSCEKEWFHFHCVGLKKQPKGVWFCSEKCANEYKKMMEKESIKEIKRNNKNNS